MIYILIVLIPLFIIGVFLIKSRIFTRDLVFKFKKCNVVVAGKKGSGKDLLFQKVINCRKDTYYSNVNYGGKFLRITPKDISVYPNTYDSFINDSYTLLPHTFIDKKDFYISDGGVYLPSYMDSKLYKTYPSMPIFYALSRHLYSCNIHVNIQNFGRLWKALREQADFFVYVKKTIWIFGFAFSYCISYDKLESAEKGLLPLSSRILNNYSKAEVDLYNANNGEIKGGWVIQHKKSIHYDTRAFEKLLLTGSRKIDCVNKNKVFKGRA